VSDHAVVVVTDATLFDQAHRVVRELDEHCAARPDVYCFHRGLGAEQLDALARVPRVHPVALDDVAVRSGPLEHHEDLARAPLFYARFECFGTRFDAYATVTYLDVDVLVRANLAAAVAGADFAAVPEAGGRSPFDDPDDPALVARLDEAGWGHDFGPVMNAGVFSLGRRWRTAEQRALLDRIIERYAPFLRVGDQSVLNIWIHANGLSPTLDPRWNCQVVRTLDRRGAIGAFRRAGVVHFNGLRADNQHLAIRVVRPCCRVPVVGPALAVAALRVIFDGYRRRPYVTAILRRILAVRERLVRRPARP
jgi:lipopolysaccharide biosynthesis glycosyltransferase